MDERRVGAARLSDDDELSLGCAPELGWRPLRAFSGEQRSDPWRAPGEQSMAYLRRWHGDLAAQARDAGLDLPAALAG